MANPMSDAIDAARWRKFISLDTLPARDALERWGTDGMADVIDRVIAFDLACAQPK